MGQQAEYCSMDILDRSHGSFSPAGCKSNFSTSILQMMSRIGLTSAGGLSTKGEETLYDGEAGEENSMLVEDEYGV